MGALGHLLRAILSAGQSIDTERSAGLSVGIQTNAVIKDKGYDAAALLRLIKVKVKGAPAPIPLRVCFRPASLCTLAMSRPQAHHRTDYRHFHAITTRWMDNDAYRHVNNVVYYSWFDTVVNEYLIRRGVLDIELSPVIGLVVETHCQYFSPVSFPDTVHAGLRVAKLGNASVRYDIGLFRNDDDSAAAQGYFIHVYVDRAGNIPVPLPAPLRLALEPLLV